VWRVLKRLGTPSAEIEDGLQEVFLVVARKLPAYQERGELRAWLFTIARQVASHARRAEVRRQRRECDLPEPERGPDPHAVLERSEATRFVEQFHLGVYNRVENGAPDAGGSADASNAVDDAAAADRAAAEGSASTIVPSAPPACASTGCFASSPISYADPDLHCERLTAHAPGDRTQPYPVPYQPDHYVRFTFKLPQPGTEYARSFQPVISQAIALHHMKLYESHGEVPEGVEIVRDTRSALRLVYSWSPGDPPMFLDPSLGIEVDPNTYYTLETHLYLSEPRTLSDASGFEVCFTPRAPTYVASISRLGRDPQMATSSSATCTPRSGAPIQLLAVQAQMNIHGRHASLAIERASGARELIYDQPFDFTTISRLPVVAQPLALGDRLRARCDYDAPSSGGPGVDDEFCALDVLHWPAHTLVSADTVGPTDRCTE
jgi:hypothetical protein